MTLSNVDFPHPFGPMIVVIFPISISLLTDFKRFVTLSYEKVTFLISMNFITLSKQKY
ncbi:Uncharacterised protein [Streptococcus pneumoniae]|nr:hypothetical protein B4155_4842 [Bacillus cereus]CEY28256.1 Uncharacterised protein [Streptococcus pneumoniae]CJB37325.1 Uncharacterised protein [Streptococcus pneumoniae]CJD53083.1 Uncharacterised protein [Streptococcus pneumoniae]CJH51751.1 Uncharacterised protein [Streptococcus pneumoniae]